MKKKVAQVIADFLVDKGVTDLFTVTGGGAMHLNDALGHKEGLRSIYNHHEQACAIAAEGYARYTGRIAAVCVTSGPGGTNAITGVLGAWQDSIPMFVVSGQVKRETTVYATPVPLRQLGDQEFDITTCVGCMTKYAKLVWQPEEIMYHLEKAWYLANNGRKGPVWLDIPLDVQAAVVETDELTMHFDPDMESPAEDEVCKTASDVTDTYSRMENPVYDESLTAEILEKIREAKRPVIFAGTAINHAEAKEEFLQLADTLKLPVVTAWNAHDILEDDSPYDAGRPGTVGNRGGNFVVQNCDLLLVLGSRLNIRIASYNYRDFAGGAFKIIVDIDEKELKKPTVIPDMPVHANLKDVCLSLTKAVRRRQEDGEALERIIGDKSRWLSWCVDINKRYPACRTEFYKNDKPLNHYVFNHKLFKEYLKDGDAVGCGNGAACVVTFQSCHIKKNQRVFTNSGCAAMGYGFPAAIGMAVARESASSHDMSDYTPRMLVAAGDGADEAVIRDPKKPRVICIDGDGSFQMNIQELQTVVYNKLNLKIIIINNNGYHSIRQTQTNLFKGQPYVGICDGNGVSFPDLSKLAPAYGLPYYRVDSIRGMKDVMDSFLNEDGPALLEAIVDETQNFEPKLSSKVLPDGRIVSPPQDDMFPFLPKEEYEANKDMSCFE